MGSGKTTLGKLLSSYLNYAFIDTDQLIEKQQGMSIDDIFRFKGETFFRNLESNVLLDLPISNTVLSTGGGLPVFNNNLSKLNKLGLVLYLKTNEVSIFKRVSTQIGRPLFGGKEGDISNLISQREKFYNKANYVVNTNDISPDEVLNNVVKILFS